MVPLVANDTLAGLSPSPGHLHSPAARHLHVVPRQPARAADMVVGIESTLADFLTHQVAMLEEVDPALGGFARTARDLVLAGGKRLRPTFAYWGWRGVVDPQ